MKARLKLDQLRSTPLRYAEKKPDPCGAGSPGGKGFQRGNTCGQEEGAGEDDSTELNADGDVAEPAEDQWDRLSDTEKWELAATQAERKRAAAENALPVFHPDAEPPVDPKYKSQQEQLAAEREQMAIMRAQLLDRLTGIDRELWPQVVDRYLQELRDAGQAASPLVEHLMRRYAHDAQKFERWMQAKIRRGESLPQDSQALYSIYNFERDQEVAQTERKLQAKLVARDQEARQKMDELVGGARIEDELVQQMARDGQLEIIAKNAGLNTAIIRLPDGQQLTLVKNFSYPVFPSANQEGTPYWRFSGIYPAGMELTKNYLENDPTWHRENAEQLISFLHSVPFAVGVDYVATGEGDPVDAALMTLGDAFMVGGIYVKAVGMTGRAARTFHVLDAGLEGAVAGKRGYDAYQAALEGNQFGARLAAAEALLRLTGVSFSAKALIDDAAQLQKVSRPLDVPTERRPSTDGADVFDQATRSKQAGALVRGQLSDYPHDVVVYDKGPLKQKDPVSKRVHSLLEANEGIGLAEARRIEGIPEAKRSTAEKDVIEAFENACCGDVAFQLDQFRRTGKYEAIDFHSSDHIGNLTSMRSKTGGEVFPITFPKKEAQQQIVDILQKRGEGSGGIILFEREGDVLGHFVNVENVSGATYFVDGIVGFAEKVRSNATFLQLFDDAEIPISNGKIWLIATD